MFLLITVFSFFLKMAVTSPLNSSSAARNNFLFATELFHGSCKEKPDNALIISPFSLNTALGLLYIAAGSETAEEIRKGLHLGNSQNKQRIAEKFRKLLQGAKKNNAQIETATKIYLKEGNKINPSFNVMATKNFDSEAEEINFNDSSNAVKTINKWVALKTKNKIQNIYKDIDGNTELIALNVIYFKGYWDKPFSSDSSQMLPFYNSPTEMVEVNTMYGDDNYKYGKLTEWKADCLELFYKDSEMSMMFILPNDKNGLSKLEENFNKMDFIKISNELQVTNVDVFIPKFQIVSELSFKNVLMSLGMTTMFSNKADLSGLFENVVPIKVNDIQQKAFIDVNEAGSEATAASFVQISLMSFIPDKPVFRADHPFLFFLKDKNSIYFAGRVKFTN